MSKGPNERVSVGDSTEVADKVLASQALEATAKSTRERVVETAEEREARIMREYEDSATD